MQVDWTDKGKELVLGKRYKYFSTHFGPFVSRDTGKEVYPVLFEVSLTNTPVMTDLPPVELSDLAHSDGENKSKENTRMDYKEILDSIESSDDVDPVSIAYTRRVRCLPNQILRTYRSCRLQKRCPKIRGHYQSLLHYKKNDTCLLLKRYPIQKYLD
jgi:hypothetical protein